MSVYKTGKSCPLCRQHYRTAKPIRFLLRYGLCLTCWTKADPDRRKRFDPFKRKAARS